MTRPTINHRERAKAAYDFYRQPYGLHARMRREAIDRALDRPAMRRARAIVQRLHAALCAVHPEWGIVPSQLSISHYEMRKARARRRYQRAFDRYHNVMRPAAIARAGGA